MIQYEYEEGTTHNEFDKEAYVNLANRLITGLLGSFQGCVDDTNEYKLPVYEK